MLGLRHAGDFLDPTVGLLNAFADDLAEAVARVPGGSRVDVGATMRGDVLRHMRRWPMDSDGRPSIHALIPSGVGSGHRIVDMRPGAGAARKRFVCFR